MTPLVSVAQRTVPVLVRARAGKRDGRIHLLMRPAPAFDPNPEVQLLLPIDVRVLPARSLEMFFKDIRAFEREYGAIHASWQERFRWLLQLVGAAMKAEKDVPVIMKTGVEKRYVSQSGVKEPIRKIGELLNIGVKDAVFAIWWSERQHTFAPGIFCADAIVALHALAFMQLGTRGEIATCDRCGTPFIKARKAQAYCSTSCQTAEASARSREKRKKAEVSGGILPDVLDSDLDILFCGTAAGEASMERAAYYAGPGNRFWPTLHKVRLTPHRFAPEDFRELLELRMGLTDLVKTACGNDCDLSKDGFDRKRLKELIATYRPRILAFTSKRAAEESIGRSVAYGRLPEKIGDTVLFALPSPSGNARRYWTEQPWEELSRLKLTLSAGRP
jgi:TDG/mug DNA glycosylase family protein